MQVTKDELAFLTIEVSLATWSLDICMLCVYWLHMVIFGNERAASLLDASYVPVYGHRLGSWIVMCIHSL